MRISLRSVILLILLTLAAGALGGWLGVVYGERMVHPPTGLHALIHKDLHLTAAQNHKIDTLEKHFAVKRAALEAEMRAANRDLATALDSQHSYSAAAEAAVERFHHSEMQLQIATIKHVLAMRAVLDARQSRQFDQAVHDTLTAGPR